MATYTLLNKYTVGSGGVSYITLSNISQSYTDLKLVLSLRSTNSSGWNNAPTRLQFNSNTSGYSNKSLRGAGGGVSSSSDDYSGTARMFVGESNGSPIGSNAFGSVEVYIPNYTSSNTKSVMANSVSAGNTQYIDRNITSGYSNLTSSITSITIETSSPNSGWQQYSTVYLYGIKNS